MNLYNRNGLIFWTDEAIQARQMFEKRFVQVITNTLKKENRAFEFYQIEAPILTPAELINKEYLQKDYIFQTNNDLVLRPETTMGSYVFAQHLLDSKSGYRLPFVVWQHGKSFRQEQDQVLKNWRLKEFYQLEFQILYGMTTANDYSIPVTKAILEEMGRFFNSYDHVVTLQSSDRLPSYSESTQDVIYNDLELCSISKRTDFKGAKNLEVAIGTDRLVANWLDY